jgi:hypothetical protein
MIFNAKKIERTEYLQIITTYRLRTHQDKGGTNGQDGEKRIIYPHQKRASQNGDGDRVIILRRNDL